MFRHWKNLMNSSLFTEWKETKLFYRRSVIGIVNRLKSRLKSVKLELLEIINLCISHLGTKNFQKTFAFTLKRSCCALTHIYTHCNLTTFIEFRLIRLRIGQTWIINASAQHKIFAYISAQKNSFKFSVSLVAALFFSHRPLLLAHIQFIFIFFSLLHLLLLLVFIIFH